jgi:hypothetical protein
VFCDDSDDDVHDGPGGADAVTGKAVQGTRTDEGHVQARMHLF